LWPERDADPSPPSSAEVKNRVELYLYSPFVACEKVKPTYVIILNYMYTHPVYYMFTHPVYYMFTHPVYYI